jgi:hypothetical protein
MPNIATIVNNLLADSGLDSTNVPSSAFPSQTGNNGKYLTTDGSAMSWGTVSTNNIYNSDGTLTGNRILTTSTNNLEFIGSGFFNVKFGSSSFANQYVWLGANTIPSIQGANGTFGSYQNLSLQPLGQNVGIFNTAPTERLDVNGNITIRKSDASGNILKLNNTVTSGREFWLMSTGASNTPGVGTFSIFDNTALAYRLVLTAAGRLLLGTTTESTFLLDVNGTARVQGAITVTGTATMAAVNGTIARFTGNAAFGVNNIGIGGAGGYGGGTGYWLEVVSSTLTINNTDGSIEFKGRTAALNSYTGRNSAISQVNPVNNFSVGINSYFNQYKAVLNGTGNASVNTMYVRGYFVDTGTFTPNSTTIIPIGFENVSGTNLFNSTSGSTLIGSQYTSLNVSAKLQVDSTTQGALLPRMTAAERAAIATPATGLLVYQTDATEGLYQNLSTGWAAIGGGVDTNIYNTDGTLTGDRTLTANGNSLTFLGGIEPVANNQIGLELQTSANNKETIEFRLSNTFTTTGKTYRLRSLNTGDFDIANDPNNRQFFIASDGKVVINTSTKISSAQLSVNGSIATSAGLQIQGGIGSPTGQGIEIEYNAGTAYFTAYNRTTSAWLPIIIRGSQIDFTTANVVRGRFTAAGRLLLGTTTESTYILDVVGNSRVTGNLDITNNLIVYNDSQTNGSVIALGGIRTNGRIAVNNGIVSRLFNTTNTPSIYFGVFYNTGNVTNASNLNYGGYGFIANGTSSIGLSFFTNNGPDTSTVLATEKMRLQGSGSLRLLNYTTTTSFTGTLVGLLGFDSSGNVLTVDPASSDTNIYNTDGTLTGNRTVTLGLNNLTFDGSAGGNIILSDATHIKLGTTTGTKFGTLTSEKLAFYGSNPIAQQTTSVTAGAFVQNSVNAVYQDSTFSGYTVGQVVEALRFLGLLA